MDYFDYEACAWAAAQIKLGKLESIQISSPYAGASFLSRDSYRQLVFDSVSKMSAAVQQAGGHAYLHTCGHIADRLRIFAETGVAGIECMDPPPLGDTTLEQAVAEVGNDLCLKGNIDSVNVLLNGSDEQVQHTIKTTIENGKQAGGFILSSACSIAPNVPPERVELLGRAVDEFGYY